MVTNQGSGNVWPERHSVSIVLLGKFNPAIFQPFWFSECGLISRESAGAATVGVIHQDVAQFAVESFSAEITQIRAKFETNDPANTQILRDVVASTFAILEHTPIAKFGFNSNKTFYLSSEEEWHSYGHHFGPKQSWNAVIESPGLLDVTMVGTRAGSKSDRIQISTGPSPESKRQVSPDGAEPVSTSIRYGIRIDLNEHYDLEKEPNTSVSDRNDCLLQTLQSDWNGFLKHSDEVSDHLLSVFRERHS